MGRATRNIVVSNSPRQNRKYSIVIPAAGLGKRMKKYGPKCLTKIGKEEDILGRQIKIIESIFRWFEIIVVTGFEHEKMSCIAHSKVKTVYNREYEQSNVVSSIGLGLNECSTDNVILLYGDLVFNKQLLNIPIDAESCLVVADSMKKEEVGCTINDGYLEQMFYGLPNKWAQTIYLKGKELDLMKTFCSEPDNGGCYGFEAINYILENGGRLKTLSPKNVKVIDIDTPLDIKKIKEIIG